MIDDKYLSLATMAVAGALLLRRLRADRAVRPRVRVKGLGDSMMEADDPEKAWTFDLIHGDGTATRIYAVGESNLAFYDPDNDSAWISSERAIDVRDRA